MLPINDNALPWREYRSKHRQRDPDCPAIVFVRSLLFWQRVNRIRRHIFEVEISVNLSFAKSANPAHVVTPWQLKGLTSIFPAARRLMQYSRPFPSDALPSQRCAPRIAQRYSSTPLVIFARVDYLRETKHGPSQDFVDRLKCANVRELQVEHDEVQSGKQRHVAKRGTRGISHREEAVPGC